MASCTLYGIVARDGRSVVVFRRGPSRFVLLLRWWLDSDRIEEGQWLRGRIHEDRCDLSPDGEYLLYFATKRGSGDPFGTWSAISRPPFFTALALWPVGDTWSGGGIFVGPRQVGLFHESTKMALAPGFALPEGWRVEPFACPVFPDFFPRPEFISAMPSRARDCSGMAGSSFQECSTGRTPAAPWR